MVNRPFLEQIPILFTLFTEIPVDTLPNGDAPIEVIVDGLNEKGQISVKQIGDDAQLKCRASRSDTGEVLVDNVRYGWDWRYLDNNPAITSNVAVGIKTDGNSMELHGIRAPEGLGGRGIKGRCVLHVPAKYVDPNAPDGDKELTFTSPYFMVVVDRLPVISQSPIPGHPIGRWFVYHKLFVSVLFLNTMYFYLPLDGISVEIEGTDNGELKASQGSDAKLDCVVKSGFSTLYLRPIYAAGPSET